MVAWSSRKNILFFFDFSIDNSIYLCYSIIRKAKDRRLKEQDMKKIYEVLNGENNVLNDYRTEQEARDFMQFAKSKGVYTYLKILTIKE